MPSNQDKIFQDSSEPKKKETNQKKLNLSWLSAPIKAIAQTFKNVTLLAAFFMFVWGMSEQFLPHELRLTTFIAARVVRLENLQNTGTAKTAAQKAETIAAAQGAVQLIQNCEAQRNNTAQQVFATCLSQPNALMTGCEFQRDLALEKDCSHYSPQQLSPVTFNQLP